VYLKGFSNQDQKNMIIICYSRFEVREMLYSHVTQHTISYIEHHIYEPILLEELSKKIGYSKYHLLRVFKQETGQTIGDYIRLRKLAIAAKMLIQTEESIIQLAFLLNFQSQEAFSRAFKDVYALPPGKYRKWMKAIQMTEEDISMEQKGQVKGWSLSGSNPELYEVMSDTKVFHSGEKSGLLYAVKEANEQQFGTMMQAFQAKEYKGKRVKLSCFLKTEAVTKAGAWMRIDNTSGDTIQFDNMDSRSIYGTTEWNYYSICLDVPEESDSVHFGVLLIGKGKIWADGFRFEVVDEKTPTTNMLEKNNLPDKPVNLTFSE